MSSLGHHLTDEDSFLVYLALAQVLQYHRRVGNDIRRHAMWSLLTRQDPQSIRLRKGHCC